MLYCTAIRSAGAAPVSVFALHFDWLDFQFGELLVVPPQSTWLVGNKISLGTMGKFVKRTVTALVGVPTLYMVMRSDVSCKVLGIVATILMVIESHAEITRPVVETHAGRQLVYPRWMVLATALIASGVALFGHAAAVLFTLAGLPVVLIAWTLLAQARRTMRHITQCSHSPLTV